MIQNWRQVGLVLSTEELSLQKEKETGALQYATKTLMANIFSLVVSFIPLTVMQQTI